MIRWLIALAVLGAPGGPAEPPPPILTLDQALSAADAHQPDLRAERAQVDVMSARADEARSPLLPQVLANATYQRTTENFAARPGVVPTRLPGLSLPSPSLKMTNYNTLGAIANQLLFDFGATWDRWRSSRELARAEGQNARAQHALREVAAQTLENERKHLAQVKGFVEVGTRPEIDLVQEQTAEANDRVQLIQAQNGYETSKAQLNQAMGVEQDTRYDVQDVQLPPVSSEDEGSDALMALALAARPELAADDAQIHAQELAAAAVRGTYWPTLSLTLGATDNGPALDSLVWNLYGQVGLSWNIFQGFLTNSQVAQTNAAAQRVRADYDLSNARAQLIKALGQD